MRVLQEAARSSARVPVLIAACGLALSVASCDGEGAGGSAAAKVGAGGGAIPTTPASTTSAPVPNAARAAGAPKVAQFRSPRRFWCLAEDPEQAQVIVGWSVPTATKVAVLLDGRRLHSGIRNRLPFWVPAGDASGIGATVVFPCESGERHRVTVRWRKRSSPPARRSVTIHKVQRR